MSRKHFVTLAGALAESRPSIDSQGYGQWLLTCDSICNACAEHNYAFDRDKFMQACRA